MPTPIQFRPVLTRAILLEWLDAIEAEVEALASNATRVLDERIRELKRAIETKPIDLGE